MSKLCVVLAMVAAVGCSRRNPEACCITQEYCDQLGFPTPTLCEPGLACDGERCVEPTCSRPGDCVDPTLPYCVDGFCVACDSINSVGCSPTSPVCNPDTATCGACDGNEDCTAYPGSSICDNGACIACRGVEDCGNPTPVCDDGTCRGCARDIECMSGACDDTTGSCLASGDLIHMAPAGVDQGSCTEAAPCVTFAYAFTQLTPSRTHVLMQPGAYTGAGGIGSATAVIHASGAVWDPQVPSTVPPIKALGTSGGSIRVIGLRVSSAVVSFVAFGCSTAGGRIFLDGVTHEPPPFPAQEMLEAVDCEVTIRDVTTAGGVEIRRGSGLLERSRFTRFAGVGFADAGFVIENCLFHDMDGQAIYMNNGCAGSARFNTFANIGRTMPSGRARAIECYARPDQAAFLHNIVWAPTGGGSTDTILGGCAFTDNIIGPIPWDDGVGNLAVDPAFVIPNANYHLLPSSPALDKSTSGPANDIDGEARPGGTGWDWGSDELVP